MSDIGIVFISVHNMRVKNKLPELFAQIHYNDNQILCTKLNYQKMVGRHAPKYNQYWVAYILRTNQSYWQTNQGKLV